MDCLLLLGNETQLGENKPGWTIKVVVIHLNLFLLREAFASLACFLQYSLFTKGVSSVSVPAAPLMAETE